MENFLEHHGIRKQKWGVRRFQNMDGTLTPAGKEHYRSKKPASDKRFDTNRYSNDSGSLTYLGNQKFSKSDKFNEMRNKRKKNKNAGSRGISLVTASESDSGRNYVDKISDQINTMDVSDGIVESYSKAGSDIVSGMLGATI